MSNQTEKQSGKQEDIILRGISCSPGICIGKAYLVDREGVNIVKRYTVSGERVTCEKNRFKTAVKKAKDELQQIIDDMHDDIEQHVYILETHMILFKDKMLYAGTLDLIEKDKVNAEWALKKVVSKLKNMFKNISDPYLKSRSEDIVQVSDRIMRNLIGVTGENISAIEKRVILVAHDLTPAETSQIQLEKIKGFVTDRGGKSSHTSIIAKTLELPSVQGLENATGKIRHDDFLVVDGSAGIVIINPSEESLFKYEARKTQFELYQAEIARKSHLSAETRDGYRLNLMGNIELAEEVVSVKDKSGSGIGLFRTEFQYLNRSWFPSEDELFEHYSSVLELMAPNPVTIRTLDINGDKALSFGPQDEELNPALGLRAIRFCLKRPEVFRTQLKAILRASRFGNLKILFPMISGVEEVVAAKEILREAESDLIRAGKEFSSNIEVGIMIEVPSAALLAENLADHVDFFSIGTNDLIQYLLAIDRENREVAHRYQPMHPAVLKMLKSLVDVCEKKEIGLSMCGEMAGELINLPILIGLGFKELSMNPYAIPVVKNVLRKLDSVQAQSFTERVLKASTSDEILNMIKAEYGDVLFEDQYDEKKARQHENETE